MNKSYAEIHKMDTLYPLLVISITAVVNFVVYFVIKLYELEFFYVSMTAAGVLTSLFLFMKLHIKMDTSGIKYKLSPFHWKYKSIAMDDIKSIYVRSYKPIREYGGWGIRMGKNGSAYTVQGTQGIQIELKDGKKVMLGTNKPVEWENFLTRNYPKLGNYRSFE